MGFVVNKSKKLVLRFGSALLFLTGAVFGAQPNDSLNHSSIVQMSPKQADKLIQDSTVSILDVRTKEEYNAGHIKGAILIPVQELQSRISEIDSLKNKKVLVYCRSGNRSKKALDILTQSGFSQLYHLEKGIKIWMQDGFKIEQ